MTILVVALAVRAAAWWTWAQWPGAAVAIVDPAWHARLGAAIAAGDLAAGTGAWQVTPGPAYLFALGDVLGLGDALGQAALQLGFGLLTVLGVWASARELGGPKTGAAAGWLAALCGPLIFQDLALLAVAPATLGLAVAGTAALTGKRPLLGGLALGLATWIRPNLLLVAPVAVALLLRRGSRTRAVPYALGLALALLPGLARNVAVSGEWVLLSANGGYNLALSQEPGLRQNLASATDAPTNLDAILADLRGEPAKALGREVSAREADAWWRAKALEGIRADVPGFFYRLAGRAWLIVGTLDTQDHRAWHAHRRDRLGWLPDPSLAIPGLAVLGIVALWRRPDGRPLAVGAAFLLLAGVASLAPFVVSERYRLPMLGLVLPLAGVGIVEMLRRPRLALVVLLVGIAGSVDPFKRRVVLPWPVLGATSSLEAEGGRREQAELAASASALVEAGRAPDAIPLLERAIFLVPERFELAQNLASLYLEAGRKQDAVRLTEAMRDRFPTDPRRALLVCSVTLQAGDSGALSACEAAKRLAPRSAAAWWQVGMARWAAGDRSGAEEAVVRALRIDPSLPGGREALAAIRGR